MDHQKQYRRFNPPAHVTPPPSPLLPKTISIGPFSPVWSSVKDAFKDSVAAAREASKAHARSRGGSDRVGEGTRRAFWKAFRKEMETRSFGTLQSGWFELKKSNFSLDHVERSITTFERL